jgi:hypothetical protein
MLTIVQLKSDSDKMKESCLQILAFSVVVVGVVEAVSYMLWYSRPSFRATTSKLINTVRPRALFSALSSKVTLSIRPKKSLK